MSHAKGPPLPVRSEGPLVFASDSDGDGPGHEAVADGVDIGLVHVGLVHGLLHPVHQDLVAQVGQLTHHPQPPAQAEDVLGVLRQGEAAWKVLGSNPGGLAAVIGEVRDVSFLEDLKHTLRFCYYWGTNNPRMPERTGMSWPTRADGPMIYLTTTDTAWEVNLTTEYKIYENLVVNLDAAYVRIDADGDTWHGAEETQYKDNYRFSVLFTYSF